MVKRRRKSASERAGGRKGEQIGGGGGGDGDGVAAQARIRESFARRKVGESTGEAIRSPDGARSLELASSSYFGMPRPNAPHRAPCTAPRPRPQTRRARRPRRELPCGLRARVAGRGPTHTAGWRSRTGAAVRRSAARPPGLLLSPLPAPPPVPPVPPSRPLARPGLVCGCVAEENLGDSRGPQSCAPITEVSTETRDGDKRQRQRRHYDGPAVAADATGSET